MIRRAGRHRRKRTVLATAAAAILAGGGTAAGLALSSGTAHAEQVATCQSGGGNGGFASCTVTAVIPFPQAIQLQYLSEPGKISANFTWSNVCAGEPEQDGSGMLTAGSTEVQIPGSPSSCTVTATMTLLNAGSISVFLQATEGSPTSSSTSSTGQVTYHTIRGIANKCLDDAGNVTANRAKIVIWTCSNTDPAQGWSVHGGELRHNGLCLNAKGNGSKGAPVMLWQCTGSANEIWSHRSNGEYALKAGGYKVCLNDPGSSTRNGTQVVVWTCVNSSSEHWTVP